MRHTIIITSVWLIFSVNCEAQNVSKSTTLFLLAGPSYLAVRGMTYNSNFIQKGKDHLGYSIGLGGTSPLGFFNKHLLLSMRLLLERRRFQVNYVAYNAANMLMGESDQDFSKYYITACFIPQVIIGKYFNIGIGYYFSQLIKQTVDIHTYNNLFTFGSPLNQASPNDHGISFAFGYSLPLKDYIFTVQLSNNYGTKNAFTYPGDTRYFNTYSILFGVGYRINNPK